MIARTEMNRPEWSFPASSLHTTTGGIDVAALHGRRELLHWYLFRFLHIRVLYNWAWDPDRFDLNPGTVQYGLREKGPYKDNFLGGFRITAPKASLSETMTAGLPFFRSMATHPSDWEALERDHDLVVEVSRFALAVHRMRDRVLVDALVRNSLRAIFWEQARLSRPFTLVVVNPFLLSKYQRYGLVMKVLGTRDIPAASVLERKVFGAVIPHHVVLINAAESERRCVEGKLPPHLSYDFIFDGMSAYAQPFHLKDEAFQRRTQAAWDLVTGDPGRAD